ncbi:hypothetical protein KUTeg_012499 [Tegillarca granosa]|uniref:STING ligand-binding domain-containing protein n=1 Tax=Tegillarca granosa TaxID=220873 RepID=A0ABQ9EZW0_TEGGR|nr:hypothetical protein KUTeg_012499 [Tegillarca granosa]
MVYWFERKKITRGSLLLVVKLKLCNHIKFELIVSVQDLVEIGGTVHCNRLNNKFVKSSLPTAICDDCKWFNPDNVEERGRMPVCFFMLLPASGRAPTDINHEDENIRQVGHVQILCGKRPFQPNVYEVTDPEDGSKYYCCAEYPGAFCCLGAICDLGICNMSPQQRHLEERLLQTQISRINELQTDFKFHVCLVYDTETDSDKNLAEKLRRVLEEKGVRCCQARKIERLFNEKLKTLQVDFDNSVCLSGVLYEIIPKSCQCQSSLAASDKDNIIKEVASLKYKKLVHGTQRLFHSTIYLLKGDDDKDYYFVGEYASPVKTLYNMNQSMIAGLNNEQLVKQVREFKELSEAIQNCQDAPEKRRNKCKFVYFDDTKRSLSSVLYEKLKVSHIFTTIMTKFYHKTSLCKHFCDYFYELIIFLGEIEIKNKQYN